MAQTQTGKLTITLDFEIGWGVWESDRWRVRESKGVYRELRPALRSFVDFLDSREIALCWATVGAMISPRRAEEFAHLPLAAQTHIARFLKQAETPTIEGRDLFDMVIAARTPQQIASHSYSHTRFNYPGFTAAMQTEDLKRARTALDLAGAASDAFVFPENVITGFEAANAAGHRVARTLPLITRHTGIGKLDSVLRRTVATPPLAQDSANALGIAEQSGSMFFNWWGRGAKLRRVMTERQARIGLDHAIEEDGILHLWLHPFNLTDSVGMADSIRTFLDYFVDRRDAGKTEIAKF
ncbi:MAG: hypothetical protein ABJP70_02900 [Erythrobacter sp.]